MRWIIYNTIGVWTWLKGLKSVAPMRWVGYTRWYWRIYRAGIVAR